MLGPSAPSWSQDSSSTRNFNVLLITVDCLRPDHMGLYGYSRGTTPSIDKFFEGAARFSNAFAHSAWTSPAMISLLTGLYPAVHGMDARGKFFDRNFETPLKQLQKEGYLTLGYDTAQNYANQGWDGEIKKGALIETLKKYQDKKFFAWAHFREPHLPYSPPEEFKNIFFKGPYSTTQEKLSLLATEEKIPKGTAALEAGDAAAIRDLYDAEVLYQDSILGNLFDFLNSNGLAERTIVILTADHGEELMEHGFIGHASTSEAATLFDEVIRIPLLIRVPGNTYPEPIQDTARQIDVMPTLFDLLRLKPQPIMQGESLLPLFTGKGRGPPRPVFMETSYCGWQCPEARRAERIHAARHGGWKLIEERTPGETRYALYHIDKDPMEKENLFGKEFEKTRELGKLLLSRQKSNLKTAYSLALRAVQKHLEAAEELLRENNCGAALEELQEALHLNEIYSIENPSFVQDPEYAPGWKEIMARVHEKLGRVYVKKARNATP